MSDRVTLSVPTSNVQTRAFQSHSYNPPLTLGLHRSRRTLSLPAREKPVIPPVITETPDCSRLPHEQHSAEFCMQANYDEIGRLSKHTRFKRVPGEYSNI